MVTALELLVNMWTFGAPAVVIAGAALRLMTRVPARARYLFAVAAFLAALALPLWMTRPSPAFGTLSPQSGARGVVIAEPVAEWIMRVWIGVALLLLVRDAIGHLRLRRMRHSFVRSEWPHDVPLLLSPNALPHTIGLLRPAVVLPHDLASRFDEDVVARIARHELSHARWRDPLVYTLLRAVAIVFWPAPAWLALRWVRREREAAADAYALRGSDAPETYVEALLRLARPQHTRELAAAMASSDLEYRARRILAPRRVSFAAVLVIAGGAMLLSVIAPAQLQLPEPPPLVSRIVIVDNKKPVTTTVVQPKQKPLRGTPRNPRNSEEPARAPEVRVPPPRALIEDIDTHVDVSRHVHVAKHAAKHVDEPDDRQVIRVVIRN